MASCLTRFAKNGKTIYGAAFNYKTPGTEQIDEPVFFLKSPSGYIEEGQEIQVPNQSVLLEELELGVVIGKTCRNVSEENALDYVGGYCLALDLTLLNELTNTRSRSWPWVAAKSFHTCCPVGKFIPKEEIPNPDNVELWCTINGDKRQFGNTSNLVFSVAQLISYLSKNSTLLPNDLILTGTPPTPSGVSKGDIIEGGIVNGPSIKFHAS